MTTGTTTLDGRFFTNAKWGGGTVQQQVGRIFSKSWSGTDGKMSPVGSAQRRVKSKKKVAVLAPQQYSMYLEDETRGLVRVTLTADECLNIGIDAENPTVDVTTTGHIGSIPAVPPEEKYKLLEKLREKAFGSGFAPWTFMAQAGLACTMIGDAAIKVGAALHGVRQRDWRLVVKALKTEPVRTRKIVLGRKDVSGRWLELQYGWLPLLHDMEDGAKYLAEALHGTPPPSSIKARRNSGGALVKKWTYGDLAYLSYGYTTYIWKLQAVLFYDQSMNSTRYIPGLYELVEVAWEVIPYSFVFDWVVPIGDYLAAMKTANDLKGRVVYTETVTAVSTGVQHNPVKCKQSVPVLLDNHYMTTTMTREIYPNLGVVVPPPLSFDVGGPVKSWQRAANAVALLAQKDVSSLAKLLNRKA